MKYFVDQAGKAGGDGSALHPFQKIQEAADIAKPGDEVLVMPGIYREAVDPVRAGTEDARIVYRSAEKGQAVISGAEVIKNWEAAGDIAGSGYTGGNSGVYLARIPNDLFGDYNPYTTLVSGDWFIATFIAHTGEVYLNGKAMYEVTDIQDVYQPKKNMASWDPDFTVYTWFTRQDEERNQTLIYANFQGADPNKENVEINVRRSCFYPSKEGVGYITFSGFTVCMAATQWAPPTAYQEGMVGPHWSKGWIIEDCDISNSKCSGISLGKYLQKNNDNKWLKWKFKDGTQTERDCICQAQSEGWTKERIGSHIVRRCNIHDCGQTGIVGHLGGVFSIIEDNHIHHINNRQNLAGAEIGGIKMHAAIDVIIRRNHFHHCTRGLWLDWQAQGTRVTQNLFHDNTLPFDHLLENRDSLLGMGEDIFIEVSHGPTLVDNNLLLSRRSLKLATQGAAVVHNLIAGSLTCVGSGVNNGTRTLVSPRYTPYHVPHRTEIAGFMTILHGDMRFYNNIFVQQPIPEAMQQLRQAVTDYGHTEWDTFYVQAGTKPYDGYQTYEEWVKEFDGYCGMGSPASDRYYIPLPVWTGGNVFCNGALPCDKERDFTAPEGEVTLNLVQKEDGWYLDTNLYEVIKGSCPRTEIIDTERLGMAFEPEEKYENPDATPITFDRDYAGNRREAVLPGCFANEAASKTRLF